MACVSPASNAGFSDVVSDVENGVDVSFEFANVNECDGLFSEVIEIRSRVGVNC
jgi:hypothetical protein